MKHHKEEYDFLKIFDGHKQNFMEQLRKKKKVGVEKKSTNLII